MHLLRLACAAIVELEALEVRAGDLGGHWPVAEEVAAVALFELACWERWAQLLENGNLH